MNPPFPSSLLLVLSTLSAAAQGTFLFDQQSSNDETVPNQGIGWNSLQDFQSGQSFTPALPAIDFVKLMLKDGNPNDGAGFTFHLNLRSGSITGPLLGSTDPLLLPNTFAGPATLLFPSEIPLLPGTTYYLNVVAETGAPYGIFGSTSYNYPGGTAFVGNFPNPSADLWFREGIIVPEPTSAALLLLGSFLLAVRRKPST